MDQLDELRRPRATAVSGPPATARGPAATVLGPEQVGTLEAAVWVAPSLLNTRPWRLGFVADRVELYADTARWVPVADPLHRAAVISCGAALRNLTLAMRWLGLRPEVLEMPDRAEPTHLATVLARPAAAAPAWEEAGEGALYRAMFHRHSHRGPLADRPVPAQWCAWLHAAGQAPGVATRLVGEDEVPAMAAVLAAATKLQHDDRHYQAELRSWLREHRPDHPVAEGLVGADAPPVTAATLARRLSRGRLALVTTKDDGPRDWLRAGQAAQKVWLTATRLDLAGSVLGVVLEAPGVRGALVERLELAGFPQLLLRLGFAARQGADGVDGVDGADGG